MKTDKKAAYRYYRDFRRPAKDFGYQGDQKRLERRFNDRCLQLVWNIKNQQCEIWYVEENKLPYCILTIKDRYNFPKAIKELEQRERSQKDILFEYLRAQDANDKDQLDQIKSYTRPYAQELYNRRIGKVSVAV